MRGVGRAPALAGVAAVAAVAALAALAVPGCGGKAAGGGRSASPANIEATCVLGADGATCTFTNYGGPGSRCVKVLYGARATGTVIASDEICSGELRGGGVVSLAVRFPRRPADTCGPTVTDCTVRVADPSAAADVALAWADELKAQAAAGSGRVAGGPLTEKECEAYALHIIDVYVTENVDEDRDRTKQYYIDEYLHYIVRECMQTLTRQKHTCVMRAERMADIEECLAQ